MFLDFVLYFANCCIFSNHKDYFYRKSIDEIHTEFQERLSSDTNTLIDISSSDPHLRKLASRLISSFDCSARNAIVTNRAIWN